MSDVLVFLVCLIDGLILLILNVYFIICLSDLECDYLNTKQGCKRLNQLVLPEIITTALIPVLLLLSWHWFLFIILCPLSGYLVYRFVTLPPGSLGVYDPTEIRNRGQLIYFQKETFVKIGYHLITFFISLYGPSLLASVASSMKNTGSDKREGLAGNRTKQSGWRPATRLGIFIYYVFSLLFCSFILALLI